MANKKLGLPALTGLRFWAALNVVLYHFTANLAVNWPKPLQHLVHHGDTSVMLFYILSGFILAYSYMDREGVDQREFWVARFSRIYPIFFTAFLITGPFYIYSKFTELSPLNAISRSAVSALLAATLTQAWFPTTALTWNGPAWSLSAEAFFYLVFPFVLPFFRRLRMHQVIFCAIGLWIIACLRHILYGMNGLPSWTPHLFTFNPLFNLPLFIWGVALGKLFLIWKPQKYSGIIALSALLGVLAIITADQDTVFLSAALIALFGILIYALACGQGLVARLLSFPILITLGEASYGIYILQKPIAAIAWMIMTKRMDALSLKNTDLFTDIASFNVYLVALITLSIIGYYVIEKPARNAIRNFYNRRICAGTSQG